MLQKRLKALGLTLAISFLGAGAALAQADVGGAANPASGSDMSSRLSQSIAVGDQLSAPTRDVVPSRLPDARRERERFRDLTRARRDGGIDGPDFTALAQTAIAASGVRCDVVEAANPGVTPEQESIYEVACATGPGYIVVASRSPRSFSCLEIEGRAAETRALYVEADVGQLCLLPANQNGAEIIGGWAREAGVACTVDEAIDIGRNAAGNVVYEVGCRGEDGYWLEKVGNRWNLTECLEVVSVGETCRFTTPLEQADGFRARLAGTDAAGCDVAQVRLIGSNPNGRYYETRCSAANEGYIVLVNEGVAQQVYPCASARRIAGGCALTQVTAPTSSS